MESTELTPFPEKKESRLDKIKSYYSMERELTPELEETRIKLVAANNLICKGYATDRIVKILQKNHSISDRQAYNYIKDAKELFGSDFETCSKAEKYVLYESFLRLHEKALKNKDNRAAVAALKEAAKIKKAYSDKVEDGKEAVKNFIINITHTTDPAALKRNDNQQTIDITPEDEV